MENSEDHSSCGCNEIFCCIFSSSRKDCHSHQKQDYLPAYSASSSESKPTHLLQQEKLKQNSVYGAPSVGQHVYQQGSSRSGSDVNEAFSDYISHAKIKIRAMTNVGSDGGEIVYPYQHGSSRSGSDVNEAFSDYISHAKIKIRAMSNVGSDGGEIVYPYQQGSSRSGSDVNEAFSDYISHAKIKIRAMSNVGSDGGEIVYPKEADEVYDYYDAEKKADANDMFSDYINRAKLKIRRASSLGSKRIISFRKRE